MTADEARLPRIVIRMNKETMVDKNRIAFISIKLTKV